MKRKQFLRDIALGIVATLVISCNGATNPRFREEHAKKHVTVITKELVVDSCEYVIFINVHDWRMEVLHKANCLNHRN